MHIELSDAILDEFRKAIGDEAVFIDAETLEKHSSDKAEKLVFRPQVVLKPANTAAVSAIMRICYQKEIPVTVQGGLSGLNGAALAVNGGVAMSMERLNRILEINKANFQVTTEPGVITEHLQQVLQAEGLFYPPDPQGKGWSFIGGNINTNAGGPKCVKYGVTRDYVLNLEIVLPNGEVLWTAANTLKFSSGYNLTHLIIGSEGTLAVVTKIVLKLLRVPPYNLLLRAPFRSAEDACAAVAAIFQAGVVPSGLEYLGRLAALYATRYLEMPPFDQQFEGFLIIEVDGNNMSQLQEDCATIAMVLEQFNVGEILYADNEAQKAALWKVRRNAGNAMINLSKVRLGEDTVVPRALLPAQIRGVTAIAEQFNLVIASLGHLGDGNMHYYILNEGEEEESWRPRALAAKRAIFELTHSLNGMLSAEHGVGFTQKNYMDIFFNDRHLQLLRGIKSVFDPKGILNPGKILPDS